MTTQSSHTQAVAWSAPIVAAIGLVGFLPGAEGVDVVRALVVLALWAPAAGWVSSTSRLGWFVPLTWWAALELAAHATGATGLDRVRAGAALAGLFLVGRGLAACLPLGRLHGMALALVASTGLAVLPGLAGALAEPWPVEIATRLLDASPVVWVCESAGIDWMRRAGVYDTVGCDRFARGSFATSFLAGALFAVGATLAVCGAFRARRLRAA